ADQRRIAPVAGPVDGDALRVGGAASDGPIDRIDEVIVHLAAPFQVGRVDEALAEADRPPEIHAEDRIAAIGEPLMRRGQGPDVAGPRAAVPQEDHGQGLARSGAARARDIADQLGPSAGPYGYRLQG